MWNNMIVDNIFRLDHVCIDTFFIIRGIDFDILACGHWYEDSILKYSDRMVESYTFCCQDNTIFIDIKY